MSRKDTANWRARERAGLKLLKLTVPRDETVAFLESTGDLRPAPGAYAGYEYSWAEVAAAANEFWSRLLQSEIEV